MSRFTRIVFYALLIGCSIQAAVAQVIPMTLQFTFCEGMENDAQTRGWITFDQSLMSNPFSDRIQLPSPIVLDLQAFVTNASSGNGHFVMSDFNEIAWDSNGGTMNFAQELVGQATTDLPWGTTPSGGEAGDFNLFGATQGSPNGEWYFTLATDSGGQEGPGTGDAMYLVSMVQGSASPGTAVCNYRLPGTESTSVPSLNEWGKIVMFLLMAGLAGFALRRQIKHSGV